MITVQDYFMGRRQQYSLSLTPQIEMEASRTVALANVLLGKLMSFGITAAINPATNSPVSSGWRPPQINANTANAAPNSKHMTGQAIDLYDPEGEIDEWLLSAPGQECMARLGLWHEHPSATKGWAHVQTIPPRSGNRTFYP